MCRTATGTWLVPIAAVLILAAALAAGGADRAGSASSGETISVQELVVPAARVISWNDSIGLLDTRSGAIYELRGNLDNASAVKHWRRVVAPVKGATSGLLELQRATFNRPDATFLVDVVTGRTWLLNRRGGSTTTWDPVEIHR